MNCLFAKDFILETDVATKKSLCCLKKELYQRRAVQKAVSYFYTDFKLQLHS